MFQKERALLQDMHQVAPELGRMVASLFFFSLWQSFLLPPPNNENCIPSLHITGRCTCSMIQSFACCKLSIV